MATGTRTFGQFTLETNNSDRVATDFADTLSNRHKTRWPLTAWLSKRGVSKQKDTDKFVVFEEDLIPRTGTCTTTITTTSTTATTVVGVSSTNGIVPNTLLHFYAAWTSSSADDAGDIVIATAVTTSVTVRRITTDLGTIADNSTFVILGNADTETSTSGPNAFDMEPASSTFYMGILKRRLDISKTERHSKVRGAADRLAEKMNRVKMDFMLDIEHASWFSRSTTDSTNSLRTQAGLIPQIAGDSNAVKTDGAAGELTLAMLADTVAKSAVDATSSNYACFHGKAAMAGIWELQMADVQTRSGETKYGMYATTITAPGGFTLDFIYCRVFDIIGAPYSEHIVGLDMGSVEPVHLEGGRPTFEKNVQDDRSGEKESHQWRYQGGISAVWPRRHWMIYDLQNAA